jgi:hypothetical protein
MYGGEGMISRGATMSCTVSPAAKNVLLGYSAMSTGTISPAFSFSSLAPFSKPRT